MNTTSFYLTPELKSKLVNLAIFVNGKFEPFVNQVNVFETDPSQCKYLFCSGFPFRHYEIYPPTPFFCKVRLNLGGIGIYSSINDYLTLLRHLLQIKGKEGIFTPQFFSALFSLLFPKSAKHYLTQSSRPKPLKKYSHLLFHYPPSPL
jgi:hypothetical protein